MKSDRFRVLLVRGFIFVRHIGGDLKIALVLGVVCIGVKGFFFCLFFLFLLLFFCFTGRCRFGKCISIFGKRLFCIDGI